MNWDPEKSDGKKRGGTCFAAHYTNQSRSRLEKLRCFGGGPEFYKLGRRVVYDSADLDTWLVSQKRRSTSDTSTNPRIRNK